MKKSVIFIFSLLPFFTFSQEYHSIFASGDWYKIAVNKTGIYKITYDELATYGINPNQIDPRKIALYGNPAGMLPETFTDSTWYNGPGNLAIQIVGEEDGVFNAEDYILFYGQSPVSWKYDTASGHFHHQVNYYTDETYYFLTVKETPGKRIQLQPNSTDPFTGIINEYDLLVYHEIDSLNILESGKRWLGETFEKNSALSFSLDFSDYLVYPSNAWFSTMLASHSEDTNFINISLNGEQLDQFDMPRVPVNNFYVKYRAGEYDTLGLFGSNSMKIDFEYNFPNDSSQAWLDYFELNLKTGPYFYGSQFCFRTTENVGADSISYFYFNLKSPEDFVFWNVTDISNVKVLDAQVNEDDVAWFQIETTELNEFSGFDGNDFYTPVFVEQIANQDLLNFPSVNLVIVTNPLFTSEAELLSDFHNSENDFSAAVVTTGQIYNEFSAGVRDVTAIRNFIWGLKTGYNPMNYVLLFGDASYDYKDRIPDNTNFLPTWESMESANMVHSFASDRYFAVKDMYDQGEQEQISLGRFPVSTISEANAMVAKIQTHSSTAALGPWKNESMFIADDGDQNLHQSSSDFLSDLTEENSPVFNVSKNYFDFYKLVETDDGPRYPEVTEEIDQKINEGVFYVNYTGHGGKSALGIEQVLTIPDLAAWNNLKMMPLWVIASGEVSRYDNPDFTSLGEEILLRKYSGAISVISSSGLNFASSNLSKNVDIVKKFSNENLQPTLRYGDLFIGTNFGDNDSKWTFLGDPALKIPFPPYLVKAIELNDQELDGFTDTISPGSTLTFDGQILDKSDNSVQNWFIGTVYLKVLAPPYLRSTNGNQGTDTQEILVQDSVLTKATAEVINGEFEISVTLPSKYFEDYGNLKLSWYAENAAYAENGEDANGYYNQLMFGGEPNSLDEFDQIAQNIKAYPSPFTNEINVELPKLEQGTFEISVYDRMGVKVFNSNAVQSGTEKIDLGFLPGGIYLLYVNSDTGSKSIKILKN